MNAGIEGRPWHGGDVTGARRKYGSTTLLDFSANINPLGLPPAVAMGLAAHIPEIVHYPDPYAREVQEILAISLGVPPETLLLGNGSIELIYLLPRILGITRAAAPVPGFSEYRYGARLASASCLDLPLRPPEYAWNLDEILGIIPQVDLMFLCNPNNPTGSLFTAADIDSLVEALPDQQAFLVMDEAFMDFVTGREDLSLARRAAEDHRILVLGSLTKFYALPGLRLGYLLGEPGLIQKLAAFLPPWNINCLAQAAARLALTDVEFGRRSREYVEQARSRFYGALREVPGLTPLPPTANFIFCRLADDGVSAPELTARLGRRGFLIRDCSNYRGLDDRCIRLAVRREEDNAALVAALREAIRGGD